MAREAYVTFEQAKSLKDLGFPQDDRSRFYSSTGNMFTFHTGAWNDNLVCPTLSVVQKWLREEKDIHIYIKPVCGKDSYYYCFYILYNHLCNEQTSGLKVYSTYEKCLEKSINEALRLI